MITNAIIVLVFLQQLVSTIKRWLYYAVELEPLSGENVGITLFESFGQSSAFLISGLLFNRVILTILRYKKCQSQVSQLITKARSGTFPSTQTSIQSNPSIQSMTTDTLTEMIAHNTSNKNHNNHDNNNNNEEYKDNESRQVYLTQTEQADMEISTSIEPKEDGNDMTSNSGDDDHDVMPKVQYSRPQYSTPQEYFVKQNISLYQHPASIMFLSFVFSGFSLITFVYVYGGIAFAGICWITLITIGICLTSYIKCKGVNEGTFMCTSICAIKSEYYLCTSLCFLCNV